MKEFFLIHTGQDGFTQWLRFFFPAINFALFVSLTLFSCSALAFAAPTYAFWYGDKPPVDSLSQFDRIIVEAGNLSDQELEVLKQRGGKVLAYCSIGELNTQQTTNVDPAWIIDSNPAWNTAIMDLTAPGWQQFLTNRADELQRRGFHGLFLDTLDSYMLPDMSAAKRTKQQQGLVTIIAQLKMRHPNFLLVANRGFEVMDQIARYLEAVAAESLYQGWDNTKQQYLPVSENAHQWLKQTLATIQSKHGFDIVVLDYLPPEEKEKALETAQKIADDGFIPWIANPSFNYLGIGASTQP